MVHLWLAFRFNSFIQNLDEFVHLVSLLSFLLRVRNGFTKTGQFWRVMTVFGQITSPF